MTNKEMEDCFVSPTFDDFYGKLSMILNGPITSTTVAVGVIGNLISIFLVKRFQCGKELLCHLITLVIWDTGVLLCSFGYYSLNTVLEIFGKRPQYLAHLTQILNGPSTTAMTGSIWTVVNITIARYLAVSKPFLHRAGATRRRAIRISLLIFCLSLCFTLPRYFELLVIPCITTNGTLSHDIAPSQLRTNPYYQLYYRSILCSFFISFIPFALTAILSIRIILLLRKSFREAVLGAALSVVIFQRTTHLKRIQRTERRLTSLMMVLLGKFLFCYTLPTTLNLIEIINGRQVFVKVYFAFLSDLSNFLVVLNSATNFIVYFWWRRSRYDDGRKRKMEFQYSNSLRSLKPGDVDYNEDWRQSKETR